MYCASAATRSTSTSSPAALSNRRQRADLAHNGAGGERRNARTQVDEAQHDAGISRSEIEALRAPEGEVRLHHEAAREGVEEADIERFFVCQNGFLLGVYYKRPARTVIELMTATWSSSYWIGSQHQRDTQACFLLLEVRNVSSCM